MKQPKQQPGAGVQADSTVLFEKGDGPAETQRPDLPAPGQRIGDEGRFELAQELGAGAMGIVFKAIDHKLGRNVAVKFLLPKHDHPWEQMIGLLKQEARMIAQLDHDSIVRIFDLGTYSGLPFLIMEYLEGRSLSALLARERLTPRRALEIMIDVTRGLEHAHRRGIIHRDLKPGNVFILEGGKAKILDFGLALFTQAEAVLASRESGDGAQQGPVQAGTPAYMSPEQWRSGPLQAATDIWSAGTILFQMLAGQHPYPFTNIWQLCAQVSSPDPPPLLDAPDVHLPDGTAQVVAKAMSKAPGDRYQSSQLTEALLGLSARLELPAGMTAAPDRAIERVGERERRQVTLLACRLAGLAALSEELELEEVGELLRGFEHLCVESVQQAGGRVLSSVSGKLLVCFGYPEAQEDGAQQAARAGLHIIKSLPELLRLLPPTPGPLPAVHIGIHTSVVIVDDSGQGERAGAPAVPAIQGEAPAIAEWLAEQAGANTIAVSPHTNLLLRVFFTTETLGVQQAGPGRPTEIHRVLQETEAPSRFDQALAAGLTPLCGRHEELHRLERLWAQAQDGLGQLVLLSGEAGIGKSRVVQELRERTARDDSFRVTCQCWSHYRHSAFRPLIELLLRAMSIHREDPPQHKLDKLEQTLSFLGLLQPEQVSIFASLLSIDLSGPLAGRYPPLSFTPALQREKTLSSLAEVLLRMSLRKPVVFIVEDLHWVDHSTMEWLCRLIDRMPTARILLVLTARPEFSPPWPQLSYAHQMQLDRLSPAQVAAMVKSVAHRPLPPELIDQLVARTDGVPLFVEELTRMVVDSMPETIPVTLQDLLLARLDRLDAPEREVIQIAAVLGRSFPYQLIRAITRREDAGLSPLLARLSAARLLNVQGEPPESRYQFRHALIQEAAYHSLLKNRRRQHHRRIAQTLLEKFPDIAATQPELLGRHYAESGCTQEALDCYVQAGQLASQRSAHIEAIAHFNTALQILHSLPPSEKLVRDELKVQLALGTPLMATKGYAAPEVEQTYERARDLCQQTGDAPQNYPALRGLWLYYFAIGAFDTTEELARQLLDLARRTQDPEPLLLGHRFLGTTLIATGRMAEARFEFEQVLSVYDRTRHRSLALLHGLDPAVAAMSYLSWVYWLQGDAEAAQRSSSGALSLSAELQHPHTAAFCHSYCAAYHQFRREGKLVQEQAEQALAVSKEHGLGFWLAWSTIFLGWALVEQGNHQSGLFQIQKGVAAWQASGAKTGLTHFLSLLAEASLAAGRIGEGLDAVTRALHLVQERGERYYEPEAHRLHGELLVASGPEHRAEAEAAFQRARDAARQQGVRLLGPCALCDG